MSKRLRLSWWRFLYVMALLAVAPTLITWATVPIDAAVFMLWILGKPWVAAAWFTTTLVVVLSLTIGSVLYGAAA